MKANDNPAIFRNPNAPFNVVIWLLLMALDTSFVRIIKYMFTIHLEAGAVHSKIDGKMTFCHFGIIHGCFLSLISEMHSHTYALNRLEQLFGASGVIEIHIKRW